MRKKRGYDIDLSHATVRRTVIPPIPAPEPVPAARRPRYEVVVPGWRPPTVNALFRGTFRDRMRLEASCKRVVGKACAEHGVAPALARRRVSLSIGLGPGQREFDRDAPYKALFDALVACGALTCDRCEGVEIGTLDFYRSPKGVTTIVIEDWPEEIAS